ncbi:thioredoxin [Metamycoplasma arthritidis]|uniref:Thioredoxin family member n=1 Tax=Metamycoplasma arthritidis (strain 158L3-1) TaxID=243272 RepID=B3PLU4_META1|nr:thioredoxin family protein [Metamycoplasma arthritidis]ACF06996.1 thioredoxin family member [Metamycoplasma arthritidis 158L3-1]VEU78525.1 thioredoxin [Metamycoplasma arthritidis]
MIIKTTKVDLENRHLTGKTILAFRAKWCPACQMIGPELEKLVSENPDINVFDFDIDEEGAFAREMGVSSTPTLFIFQDGMQINNNVGYIPATSLVKLFK